MYKEFTFQLEEKMIEQLEQGLTETDIEAGDIELAVQSLGHVIEFEEN